MNPVKHFVVIPACNEPDGDNAVNSLLKNKFTGFNVEIIVVINSSEEATEHILSANQTLFQKLTRFQKNLPTGFKLIIEHLQNIQAKKAGVGFARKVGMDIAASKGAGNAVIVCYDADCEAPVHYLQQIHNAFLQSKAQLAAIKFRHNIPEVNHPIVSYELFLRYYGYCLKNQGYPFWHLTIGSSMAVRVDAYLKHGGMNERKAGEDFYFMHKLMPVCHTITVNTTCNVLSARQSDRVPFGTGKAITTAAVNPLKTWYTYNPAIFKFLGLFLDELKITKKNISIEKLIAQGNLLAEFLLLTGGKEDIEQIKKHCKTDAQFMSRFLQYLNGFRVLKYLHWARDKYYMNMPLKSAVCEVLNLREEDFTEIDLLELMRNSQTDIEY